MRSSKTIAISFGLACLAFGAPALAWELVYVPVNPNFGGNPNNGLQLLANAQAQDRHKDPDAGLGELSGLGSGSTLQDFNQMLERAILSRITSAVTSNIVSSSGALIPGTVETSDFIITIADLGGGLLQITTTDKLTGQSTSFQISQ
jgi:curli production assembly/transport component CsgF